MNKPICFKVIDGGDEQLVRTFDGEYRNLMLLLAETLFLESFGECGGQGRCATCIVKISGIKASTPKMERNEPATLAKAGYDVNDVRLSCQIYITEALNGVVVEIV